MRNHPFNQGLNLFLRVNALGIFKTHHALDENTHNFDFFFLDYENNILKANMQNNKPFVGEL